MVWLTGPEAHKKHGDTVNVSFVGVTFTKGTKQFFVAYPRPKL